jgi:ABC-type sugar transport system permease subunit
MIKRPIAFLMPAFILYTMLMIVPILAALALSLTNWNGIAVSGMQFVGLKNFETMLTDKRLIHALGVTLRITLTVVVATNALGLMLALTLNRRGRLTSTLRSVFFLPYVLSTVAISFIWLSMLSYTGAINTLLNQAGLGFLANDYIGNPNNAVTSISIIEIWRTLGFCMVIYLAALQMVPQDLYEACTIDGGNAWHKFRYVTLPGIRAGLTISILMSMIVELRQYDIVKVITDGGPGYATETIAYNIITQAFGMNRLGYSSAIAVVLFALIGLLSILNIKLSQRGEGA